MARRVLQVTRTPPAPEHAEQVAVVQWAELVTVPGLGRLGDYLFAVPNGSYLGRDARTRAIVMRKLKAAGLKPGVPDLLLALPRGAWHGLFIEMKRRGGRVSEDQVAWRDRLRGVGYAAEVCEGADAARAVIRRYLASGPVRFEEIELPKFTL